MTGEDKELLEIRIEVASEEQASELAKQLDFEEGWAIEESKGKFYLLGYSKKIPPELDRLSLNYTASPAPDWEERFREFFGGVTVSQFSIRPPWIPEDPERINIVIYPGSGFGTREHPSTQNMLLALEKLPYTPQAALDVGCGSGILSIACLKIGIKRVVACDIDPLAISNARYNLKLNQCEDKVFLINGSPSCIKEQFPLVLANIDFFTLVSLSDVLTNLTSPKGHLILSGFLNEDAHTLEELYSQRGFICFKKTSTGQWSCLHLEKC